MGVGGGFVTFPMFVYVFGVSSMTTVGTDILQIIFTAGLAAVSQYAIYGYVFTRSQWECFSARLSGFRSALSLQRL